MNVGIYKITNNINGKVYIGKSVELDKREYVHFSRLKNNNHINKHLQSSYNKYGESAFTYSVLLYCEEKDLNMFEIRAIKTFNAADNRYGYNKTLGGEGQRPNEETRQKISESQKGEKNTCAKLTLEKVESIRTIYSIFNISHRSLAFVFNVSHRNVGNIINEVIWKEVA